MNPSHVSPFQFEQRPDGTMGLENFPDVTLNTIEEQETAVGRNWQTELRMPMYFEDWERLARIKSDDRWGHLTFILMDESPTRLPDRPRMQPKHIVLPTMCPLELGHQGFVVGLVYGYLFNAPLPVKLEGDYIVGLAHFFDSPLAKKAVQGVRRKILTHVCPTIWTPDGGGETLAQVSLVPGDYPGCDNARILSWSA